MATSQTSSIWAEVATKLGDRINFEAADKRLILDQVLTLAQEKQNEDANKQWKITRRNGKVVYIRDIYASVAECIHKFKAVGDIACQTDAGHASLPWAGVRLLLQTVVSQHERNLAVLEGMELASDLITRCAIIENLYQPSAASTSAPSTQLHQALKKLYCQILRFLSDAVHHYSRNGLTRFATSITNPVEATLRTLINSMVQESAVVWTLTELVQRQWSLESHKQVTSSNTISSTILQTMLTGMQTPIGEIHQGVSQLIQQSERLNYEAILDWLSPAPYAQYHSDTRQDRLQNTGRWLMQTSLFREWSIAPVSSLFWLQGTPGCGKSRLVSAVIDYIKEQDLDPCDQTSVAYVYFARDAAERQRGDPTDALRSLARQICVSRHLESVVERLFSTQQLLNASTDTPPPLTMAETLNFIRDVTKGSTTYLILDAMDECESLGRTNMIKSLAFILESPDSVLKIFVSSRDPVHRKLTGYASFEISPEDNFQDIERFIDLKVDEYITDGKLLQGHVSDDLKNQIIYSLNQKAQGMFLFVALQLESLSNSDRMIMETDVLAELARLPESLNHLYTSAYEQIARAGITSRHIALTTMKWLLCAQRPLVAIELLGAIAVDHEENVISITLEQTVAACRNLVVYDKKLRILRFAHLSVRDFLEKLSEFSSSENESVVAERCLDVVSATYSGVLVKGQKLQQNLDLQRYSKMFWVSHYQT